MAKKIKPGAPHPRPRGHVIRASAKKPPLGPSKVAPVDLAGLLGAENADLQEDDWISRQLPTFD